MTGIYKITNNLNGKSYIGQSIDIKRRWREHRNETGNKRNSMYVDFKKYGLKNFSFEIIEECPIEKLDEKEIYYIEYFDTYKNGYNLTLGGQKNTGRQKQLIDKEIADDISKNSQKLFNYLVCLAGNPPNMQKRVFQHKNVNISLIYRTIGISTNSIKKYWYELEKSGKIIYGNNNETPEEEKELFESLSKGKLRYELTPEEDFNIWKQLWTARKKRPCEYYEVRAGHGARNIPKETLKLLNEELQISEQDMKLYQFLLTYREVGITKMYKSFDFSMMDLRNFLGKKKERKTHISIYKSLLLLKQYGLIDFREQYELNSRNVKIKHYILTNVGFYVKPEFNNCEEEERKYINQNILEDIENYIGQHYNEKDEQ